MGFEEGDIGALRREATQELAQDDLVLESDLAHPPTRPPTPPNRRPAKRGGSAVDRLRRAREWLDQCERELREQPERRRVARLYFEMARTCEGPLEDSRRALEY